MTAERRRAVVVAIAAQVPAGRWFTTDQAAALTGLPVADVLEVLDDEAQTGDVDERRIHDDHTLYRIPEEGT